MGRLLSTTASTVPAEDAGPRWCNETAATAWKRVEGGSTMKDPVCGMQVDPAKAAGTSQYQGQTYYFCSKGCKTKFDANPGQFVK